MANQLRFGLELEMHGIVLSLRRADTGDFWPMEDQEGTHEVIPPDETMIALEPILIPVDDVDFLVPHTRDINWEGNWGFRGVGDGHTYKMVHPQGRAESNAAACIIELATAARPATDDKYWMMSRKCAKIFTMVMNQFSEPTYVDADAIQDVGFRWYPLQNFLTRYNQSVAMMAGAPRSFQLQKSQAIIDFERGTHGRGSGKQWQAYVTFESDPRQKWCDVQLNYQLSLRTLYVNLSTWIGTWSSVWASDIDKTPLDPGVGDTRRTPVIDLYRVQAYASVWRMAKAYIDASATFAPPRGTDAALLKALVMYVLVCKSITNGVEDGSTSKNAYPQLPKTSPASLAQHIRAINAGSAAFFNHLISENVATEAITISREQLRNVHRLVGPPGYFPIGAPLAGQAPYGSENGSILREPFPANFQNFWNGAFNPALALTQGNRMGFDNNPPFYVPWADEVNSSYPATPFSSRGAGQPNDEVKMLFESRYGRCVMNIGFNPYISDFLFNRSYKRVVRLLAGEAALDNALLTALNTEFPDDGSVKQNFPKGYAIH